ncbi:MAG: DUF3109 family protein [Saprospiraceae bacterium]|nr:DUF3109 family protein [Saprospiraceae bacterium]
MILVDQILVSEDVFQKKFICDLSACKGACCWEGDWGAPLEREEVETLRKIRELLRPYLTKAGNEVIDKQGTHVYYEEIKGDGTPLIEGAACVYLTFDENGIGKCGIEQAYSEGIISFHKPVSCHLYPIRHSKIEAVDFEALNYENWEICSAACSLGEINQMPVFRFVKDALIRKFGEAFYHQMEEISRDIT